jgi:hypothetical protein
MNRRSFFGLLTGAAAALGLAPRREPSYFYDWTMPPDKPETDDPAFANRFLPRGGPPVNRVTVDGEDVSHLPITLVRTGPDGYVAYQVHKDGRPVIVGGRVLRCFRYGHTSYEYQS